MQRGGECDGGSQGRGGRRKVFQGRSDGHCSGRNIGLGNQGFGGVNIFHCLFPGQTAIHKKLIEAGSLKISAPGGQMTYSVWYPEPSSDSVLQLADQVFCQQLPSRFYGWSGLP